MSKWTDLRDALKWERGPGCEVCGKTAVHLHHCLLGVRRGMPELNVKENAELVCLKHHIHSDAAKLDSWKRKVEMYGRDHMIAWLDTLPLKLDTDIRRYKNSPPQ